MGFSTVNLSICFLLCCVSILHFGAFPVRCQPVANSPKNKSSEAIPTTNSTKKETQLASQNATTDQVTIYTNDDFLGIPWTLSITNCTDVPALLYKKTSSINTHDNCVILYVRQNCTGRSVKIAPGTSGHSHLSDVNFDDDLASLKPCDDDSEAAAVSTPGKSRSRRNLQIPDFLRSVMGSFGTGGESTEGEEDGQQKGGMNLQSLMENFNLNSIMSQFQSGENDDGDESDS